MLKPKVEVKDEGGVLVAEFWIACDWIPTRSAIYASITKPTSGRRESPTSSSTSTASSSRGRRPWVGS